MTPRDPLREGGVVRVWRRLRTCGLWLLYLVTYAVDLTRLAFLALHSNYWSNFVGASCRCVFLHFSFPLGLRLAAKPPPVRNVTDTALLQPFCEWKRVSVMLRAVLFRVNSFTSSDTKRSVNRERRCGDKKRVPVQRQSGCEVSSRSVVGIKEVRVQHQYRIKQRRV